MRATIILSAGLLLGLSGACQAQPGEKPRPALTPEQRLEQLRSAVEREPENAQAQRALAIALHDAGEREEALPHFEKALELDASPKSLLDLALAYQSLSWLKKAEETYQRLLAIDPAHAIALHNLGNMDLKKGRTEEAIVLYTKAIAAKPGYLLAHFHLADALARAGRYRDSYRTYEKVLELEPTSALELQAMDDALYRMASLDLTMGAPERALQLLSELLQINPEHSQAHYAYGQALLQLGRPEEAQRSFDAHLRLLGRQPPRGPMASGE